MVSRLARFISIDDGNRKLQLAAPQKKAGWLVTGNVIILITFYFMAGSHEVDRLLDLFITIVIYYLIVFCISIFFFTRPIKSPRSYNNID
jgi:hypothetical protein